MGCARQVCALAVNRAAPAGAEPPASIDLAASDRQQFLLVRLGATPAGPGCQPFFDEVAKPLLGLLFLVAPALDWLRFDLHETQLWFLGRRWSLGIDDFMAGRIDATAAAIMAFVAEADTGKPGKRPRST